MASNIIVSVVSAPVVVLLSALSLSTLQRSLEWVTSIAKNPQRGYLKQLKPYFKQTDVIIDRIMGGNKFTINTTNVLLMTIIVLLLTLVISRKERSSSRTSKAKEE